jgi:hypothetical protein
MAGSDKFNWERKFMVAATPSLHPINTARTAHRPGRKYGSGVQPLGNSLVSWERFIALSRAVNTTMIKAWSISVTFAVVLFAVAPGSLFAQANSLPDDVVTAQQQNLQAGIIMGTVTDMNETPVPGAVVALQGAEFSDVRSVTTNENGFFEIRDVEPGRPYQVCIRAAGFAEWDSPSVTLDPGQSKMLDVSKLQIQEVQTIITVTPESSEQIATEQVKAAEKQRGFGIIPNFYAVYESNPAPLTTRLKFSLALRVARDPATLAGVALLAGSQQAANNPQYVQGAKGYGERYAANYANGFTDIMFDGVIFPALLHQDPRYFVRGKGTTQSRVVHALSSLVITRGDNGRLQPNYSSLGGDLASAAVANFYYPRVNRGAGLVFEGFGINSAIHVAVRMLDEFVFRPAGGTAARNSLNNS